MNPHVSALRHAAVQELLDTDEYHSIDITADNEHTLLGELRYMVHKLRDNGYLSTSDDLGAIVASTQTGDYEKTAMQLIRDEFDRYQSTELGWSMSDDVPVAIDGVTVYPADELPPRTVVAYATDALAEMPHDIIQPFVVRDRRGVEVRKLQSVEECDDSS